MNIIHISIPFRSGEAWEQGNNKTLYPSTQFVSVARIRPMYVAASACYLQRYDCLLNAYWMCEHSVCFQVHVSSGKMDGFQSILDNKQPCLFYVIIHKMILHNVVLCLCLSSQSWHNLALHGSNWQHVDLFEFQVTIEVRWPQPQ